MQLKKPASRAGRLFPPVHGLMHRLAHLFDVLTGWQLKESPPKKGRRVLYHLREQMVDRSS
jgi:hypothetical protein